jgi:uncharacterized protein (DUF305 family)
MTRTLTHRAGVLSAALLTGVLLSGCGSNDSGAHNSSSMPGMGNGASVAPSGSAAATFANADVTFAQQMVPHHQQAVAMAALADTRATDPDVKKLAEQIKAAQQPEITTMTGWLTAWGQPAPTASMDHGMDMSGGAMPGMMSVADMKKLTAASGKDFDKEFLTMMIAHHEGAVTMAKDEVANGKNPDATALAQQVITSQQAEIATMKSILARL